MTTPTPFSFHREGLDIAGLDWGGDGPALVFLHPNGFCAGMYHPLAARLRPRYRVLGIDLPGHGATEVPADDRRLGYDHAADDVVALLDHVGIERAAIAAVSLGAAVGIVTAARHPSRVSALLACEAIAFPASAVHDRTSPNPLVEMTLKRRTVWPDRESARASYGSKPPMMSIDPAVLDGYLTYGLDEQRDGTFVLGCPPAVEAAYFALETIGVAAVDAFEMLTQVQCPMQLASGSHTTISDAYFKAQAARVEQQLLVIDGSHFFFFEDLQRAEMLIETHLGPQVGKS